ncbi:beta-ribofuranosylaminobenzene 5'-phosphate synthase family protein [Halomarina salina]|uniref:Beta-ribofuranosylaminobenzene 5'-phosphate synthase n=1 Tax=Halomarina salina TaxID=1872699 RepID=A0ABD5RPA0_9EURY|nr:beta-ribofuranosylaminobenzene 5'-phosphate synthase family protein [Halomarina salina]
MVRVETGARLHVGFTNLSLAYERLYGGVGLALDEPRVVVEATRADGVAADPALRETTHAVCELLDLPGANVRLVDGLPHHVGLGSGTQHALATLEAIARAYDRAPRVRASAPALGRGGRSGVGVATFETGGLVVDAGHPTERFTTTPPARGEWSVPPVVARHPVPDDWRFLLVTPDGEGRSGSDEDDSMRAVVERADPSIADDLSAVLVRRLLPAVVTGERERFGRAVGEFGRLNGAWYADEQGGVYRPPVGELVAALGEEPSVTGVGQSSWGPTVYGVTDRANADAAHEAGERALDEAGVDGEVRVVRARNEGATVR